MSGGEGPDSWFSRWDKCVVGNCPDDGDITSELVTLIVWEERG